MKTTFQKEFMCAEVLFKDVMLAGWNDQAGPENLEFGDKFCMGCFKLEIGFYFLMEKCCMLNQKIILNCNSKLDRTMKVNLLF